MKINKTHNLLKGLFAFGLITMLFSFSKNDSTNDIIKKMNAFYFNKAISLNYQAIYETKKGELVEENKCSVKMHNNKYLQEDKAQVVFSNDDYLIHLDKIDKSIIIREISESQFEESETSNSFLDFEKLIDSTYSAEQTNLVTNDKSYVISIDMGVTTMVLEIEKQTYKLTSFQYLFKNNDYYNSVKVNYSNIKTMEKFPSSVFNSNNYIKKKKSGYQGAGKYKKFKINKN